MPIYEFGCPSCGGVTTELCKIGETGEQLRCSECGNTGLIKHISGFASLGVTGGAGGGSCSPGCSGNCSGVIERGTVFLNKRLNIVMVEPEIPPNTGNVARLCAATGAALHLVKPLGFSIDDKHLKRAGLDYWHLLDIFTYENFVEFEEKNPVGPRYLATTKGGRSYTDISYEPGGYLLFGKETKGLAPEIIARYPETAVRLPMRAAARSLNLSNSVAVVVYEVLRQWGFPDLV